MKAGPRFFLIPIAFIFVLTSFSSCGQVASEKIFRNGVVVCSDPMAANVGLEILKAGGNAIDAACATAMALAVTLPRAGNIGGGGFALIYLAESQEVRFLDFRETAPAGIKPEMYYDSQENVDRDKALIGPLSAGTPGTIAGLFEMHKRLGRMPWSSLVVPARYLADTGFAILNHFESYIIEYSDDLALYPSTAEIFFPDGRPPISGSQFIQKDLAWTLGLIERNGRDGFYTGTVARKIAEFCAANGGVISEEDLASYNPKWRDPVSFKFRDLDIYAPGLPSSGGIVMGQILSILDEFELEKYTADSPQYLHLFTEASRRAFADREKYLGDPDFTQDFTKELLDKNYLATRIQSINESKASTSTEILPGVPKGSYEPTETTHLVAVDSAGNIVSLTYTINLSFGSKAVVEGCGFLLNNEMDDFAIKPGQANAFGLVGGEANKIEPGKRMLSSMTPTIVFRNNKPYMALGSPGGSTIISAVTQTIIYKRIFGMSLGEAILAPRIHHQWQPDSLYMEQERWDASTIQDLISRGHNVKERLPLGIVNAAAFQTGDHFIVGFSDIRTEGRSVSGY
ncbi:MAG: gamma-glutamyltransferase [candidate division Zixibacteria bacterium]